MNVLYRIQCLILNRFQVWDNLALEKSDCNLLSVKQTEYPCIVGCGLTCIVESENMKKELFCIMYMREWEAYLHIVEEIYKKYYWNYQQECTGFPSIGHNFTQCHNPLVVKISQLLLLLNKHSILF